MFALLLAFFVSTILTLGVIRHASGASAFIDHDLSGPQKFHHAAVPRVGGVGILLAMVAAAVWLWWSEPATAQFVTAVLVSAIPAFAAGLIEDLTKRVSPGKRLLATAVSAALAVYLLDAVIRRTDIPGLDWAMAFPAFAVIATVFTVAGVANAVNIIDGFNGLASMCVILMLAAFAALAFRVGDVELMQLSMICIFAVMGFFVWNYPRGLIFLGDGGAYLLGFMVAEIGILLITRHPQVSPLVALMVCIYPVFETVFSIYRRRYLRAVPPGLPDGIHLHSLIYRRLVRWAAGPLDVRHMTARNSAVSPYLWTLCLASLAPAMLFWDDSTLLGLSMGGFALVYIGLYWRIVRFRTPGFLRRKR